ncbi:MAG: glutamine synthetase family protein [Bacillota bacterium]|nr:glutamine synthetase family protein [Bacillota bacterium]
MVEAWVRPDEVEQVVRRAEEEGVVLVRFLYCDTGGVIRGKAVSRANLEDALRSGVGLTVAMAAMNPFDQLQTVEGMGPVGEVRLAADPSTYTPLPYAPGQAALLCDLERLDGQPWEAGAREFARRMVARAAERGIRFEASFENEFSLAVAEPDGAGGERYRPYDRTLCFSSAAMTEAGDFAVELVRAFEAQGLTVQQYYPELGHGQHELSLRHAPLLRAADNQIRARETIRSVAWRMGLRASLAPKPFPDQAGNGAHVHISAWELEEPTLPSGSEPAGRRLSALPGQPAGGSGRNLFYDPDDRYRLSRLGYAFIAGVLAHLPALVALTAPTVNSYRRLGPRSWSSAYACYGPDNREAAVRIASPFRAHPEGSVNVEIKAVDNGCNPYLALGAIVAAGLDGIERGLDPGEPVLVDPDSLDEEERRARGILRLPASLEEALDRLAADTLLREALGPQLYAAFDAVKRSEAAALAGAPEGEDCRRYFGVF